jgi:hypothetical protein
MYDFFKRFNESISGQDDPTNSDKAHKKSALEATQSQTASDPREFVWEVVDGDGAFASGINIKSCGICHLFGKHDAIALVVYMCAGDDPASDAYKSGLRRTSTIGLGVYQFNVVPSVADSARCSAKPSASPSGCAVGSLKILRIAFWICVQLKVSLCLSDCTFWSFGRHKLRRLGGREKLAIAGDVAVANVPRPSMIQPDLLLRH